MSGSHPTKFAEKLTSRRRPGPFREPAVGEHREGSRGEHHGELDSERERAALAWTEALTLIADTHAPDDDYAELAEHFTPAEQAQLVKLLGKLADALDEEFAMTHEGAR